MVEWTTIKEEKSQEEEAMKLEQEEKRSIEDVVTQANEGELLVVKRVLFSFQGKTEELQENPFHT